MQIEAEELNGRYVKLAAFIDSGKMDEVVNDIYNKCLLEIQCGTMFDYIRLLDTPSIKKEERLELIDTAFATLSQDTVNLLKLLCEKRLIGGIFKLSERFSQMYDEKTGIVRVEAITAVPMTEAQCDAMREKLSVKLSRTIILTNTVDPSILGGVKLRYSGLQLDGSVKTRLDSFEESLRATVI